MFCLTSPQEVIAAPKYRGLSTPRDESCLAPVEMTTIWEQMDASIWEQMNASGCTSGAFGARDAGNAGEVVEDLYVVPAVEEMGEVCPLAEAELEREQTAVA